MHSLTELRDFFISKKIEINEFNGWALKVGRDVWTLSGDVFYKNGIPQSLKQKDIFNSYTRVKTNGKHQSNQTRKWRGISSRNYR